MFFEGFIDWFFNEECIDFVCFFYWINVVEVFWVENFFNVVGICYSCFEVGVVEVEWE